MIGLLGHRFLDCSMSFLTTHRPRVTFPCHQTTIHRCRASLASWMNDHRRYCVTRPSSYSFMSFKSSNCVSGYVSLFLLLLSAAILFLRCGDVHPHPGPRETNQLADSGHNDVNSGCPPFHSRRSAHTNVCAGSEIKQKRTNCVACGKGPFQRLDVHLRFCKLKGPCNDSCSSIQRASERTVSASSCGNRMPVGNTTRCDTSLDATAVNTGQAVPPNAPVNTQPFCDSHLPCPDSKPLLAKLKLPASDQEWLDANLYFSLHVTPAVHV